MLHLAHPAVVRILRWLFLSTLLGAVFSGIIGVAGCAREEEPPKPEPISNPQLGLSFSALPAGFVVDTNDGQVLRLSSITEGRDGEMWVEVSEKSDFGIDLVDITNSQKADYEDRAAGEYSGARKLMTPAGEAYYTRGRYEAEGLVEETRVFLVHATENRLVVFHYLHPAGEDSAERLPELFAWVGELDTGYGFSPALSPSADGEQPPGPSE